MSVGILLASPLRLARSIGVASLLSVAAGVFGLSAFLLLAAGIGSQQSIIIDAQAIGAVVSFKGSTNDWLLGDAILCVPKKIDLSQARGEGPCDARRFEERRAENLRVSWPPEAVVRVSSPASGQLVLSLLSDGEWPKETRILLPEGALSRLGALGFYGHARVGQPAVSGEQDLLLSGSYEFRERSIWSRNTEVLRSGELRRGESVEIFRDGTEGGAPANQFGHITAEAPDTPGFHVSLASETGKPVLRLVNYGGVATTTLAPNWIDRALHNSLILALALLLPVALSLVQILLASGSAQARDGSNGGTHTPVGAMRGVASAGSNGESDELRTE
ncbi:hypothetical protein [Paenirhodobacter sp. CAU 1674]|uniref:hypothetical protein n=1 Tax=Paenirhodobacter sp. CAU 1674 TaxID=3032596 RepID=UPI0023DC9E24|nr:hypothetical protein [Paenirhodobacter sp. CAU 1674]MDF2142933.1 hypothetical protein [Paenirhodobacter sp. CAU 1674]